MAINAWRTPANERINRDRWIHPEGDVSKGEGRIIRHYQDNVQASELLLSKGHRLPFGSSIYRLCQPCGEKLARSQH